MHVFPMLALALARPQPIDDWSFYAANVAAAHAHTRLGEAGEARRWLAGAPESMRGWEWRHLASENDASDGVLSLLGSPARSLDVTRDGSLACASTESGVVVLFDPSTGSERGRLEGHEGAISCARFSPDGSRLLTTSHDRTARIWNVRERRVERVFEEHDFPVATGTFSPDGSRVATCSYFVDASTRIHGQVLVWDPGTGEVVERRKAGRKPVVCSAFSPDGSRLAVGTWDSSAFVWTLGVEREPLVLGEAPDEDSSTHVNALAFSPDSGTLATAVDDGAVRVWRVSDGKALATLDGPDDSPTSVLFSRDGRRLVSGWADDRVRVFDAASWHELTSLPGHDREVRALAWAGERLVSAGADGRVLAWRDVERPRRATSMRHAASCYSIPFSPDGSLVATGGFDGKVVVWDARTGSVVREWNAHAPEPTCFVAMHPDGKRVVSCSWDKTIRLWEIESGREVRSMACPAGVAMVALSPDGRFAAGALTNGAAVMFDLETGELVRTFEGHAKRLEEVEFSRDGMFLASASLDQTARVWRVADASCVATMSAGAGVYSVGFTRDGGTLVAGTSAGVVAAWNARSGEKIRTLLTHDEPVYRVEIAPDDSRVVACSSRAAILSLDHEGPALVLRPHAGVIWTASFSPDGTRLATCSWDGTVVITDAPR